MAEQLALETFGAPLQLKWTFLYFDLGVYVERRAESAPPELVRLTAKPESNEKKKKKKKKKRTRRRDDDVLREARRATIQEIWHYIARKLIDAKHTEALRELDDRRMVRRATLPFGGFMHVALKMGYNDRDLVVLYGNRLLRETTEGGVEIWCTGRQLRMKRMQTFVEEAAIASRLCQTSVFLMMPSRRAALAVIYDGGLRIQALADVARQFCGVASGRGVRMQYTSGGGVVEARTLRAAGLRPGDSVIVHLA